LTLLLEVPVKTREIILISGKDSLTTAIVQKMRQPDLNYEFVYNYIGTDVPEIEEWLTKVEAYLGQPIIRVGENLEDIIWEQNMLPSFRVRFCTRLGKLIPLAEFLEGAPANVYYGIRADEERIGFDNSFDQNITPIYPLKEMGIDITQVYSILSKLDLLPPKFFWQTLYNLVVEELGVWAESVLSNLSSYQFDVLFAWRSRSNCYFCFYQALYEWVGLLELHPDLYEKAEEFEREIGGMEAQNARILGKEALLDLEEVGVSDISEKVYGEKPTGKEIKLKKKDFHWNGSLSLAEIREQADRILQKRARKIVRAAKAISSGQPLVFQRGAIDVTSCGLYCGK
jgi:hypothetical protein